MSMLSHFRAVGRTLVVFAALSILFSCDRVNPDKGGNKGDSVELENFTFRISNLKAGYVYVDFIPKNSSMSYYFNLVVKDDAKGKSDEEIFASDLENISYIAEQQGISLSRTLSHR